MEQTLDLKPPIQINKEQLFTMLDEPDSTNLQRVAALFQAQLERTKKHGSLVVVGGVLIKPLPRPDIDLMVIFQGEPDDLRRENFPDTLTYATADFKIFRDFVEGMIDIDRSLEISEVIEPAMDEEFENPNILKHDGSIRISSQTGATPLELIRMERRGPFREVLASQKRPFTLIKSI